MITARNLEHLLGEAKDALKIGDLGWARQMFREIDCQFKELEADYVACKAVHEEVKKFTFRGVS
jgi:hypothetical protein